MTEMIDRCARALYNEFRKGMHESAGSRIQYWDNLPTVIKEVFRGQVRAVFEAAREPTTAVLDAGPDEPYMDAYVWAKMIDACLKGTP